MLEWHATGERNGVHLKVRFFDGDAAEKVGDRVERSLCFLPGTTARMLWCDQDHRNLRWRSVVAQSDAVFELGQGLVSLEFKSRSRRTLDRQAWLSEVRLKDMLQCLIASMVVAQTQGKVCAAVLRYHNAGMLLVPQQRLLDMIVVTVPQACALRRKSDIASSKLAAIMEPLVQEDFPWRDEARSRAGVLAHEYLFR